MNYRNLGSTGLRISELSFGTGPVAALMTASENSNLQRQTIERALAAGINWFDTAPTYGAGRSESNLGAALANIGVAAGVHVATKVRLSELHLGNIGNAIKASVGESLGRLKRERVTLLQLHNSITANRGDQPTSLTPRDVLGKSGVLEAFEELRAEGWIEHFGLTGLGESGALREVIQEGPWATIQLCESILHPARLRAIAPARADSTSDNPIFLRCIRQRIGVIAIRVLAGGALAGQPPSAHTRTTPFFPLALYEQDCANAAQLAARLPAGMTLKEAAIRCVLSDSEIATALIGFSNPAQLDEAVRFADAGPLDPQLLHPG